MANPFESRKVYKSNDSSLYASEAPSKGKSGMYYTSKMQGILAEKDANEKKAATLVAEYLKSMSSTSVDERRFHENLNNMLVGFTVEEKYRILEKAIVIILTM